jgi:hypothetical protein
MSKMDGWVADQETGAVHGNGADEVWLYRVGEPDAEGRVILFDDPEEAERCAAENGGKVYTCRYTLLEVEEYTP